MRIKIYLATGAFTLPSRRSLSFDRVRCTRERLRSTHVEVVNFRALWNCSSDFRSDPGFHYLVMKLTEIERTARNMDAILQ